MSSSPSHWFVQTDFGATLGPMPPDALSEMARTGALLVRDRVREGTDGEWRPASEVPGLFDDQTPALGLMTSTLEDLFAPENATVHESFNPRHSRRPAPPKTETPAKPVRSHNLDFETDAPLIAPSKAAEPPPIKEVRKPEPEVPLHVTLEATEPVPTITPLSEPNRSAEPVTTEPVRAIEPVASPEPEPVMPTPASWQARPVPAARWQPPKSKSSFSLGRSLPSWQVFATVAVVVVMLSAWWLWPRQRPDIYKSYTTIYQELLQRRETSENYSEWTEFVAKAKVQLDETLPWLEAHSKPGDREKSLLLYVGRDLRDLLELPRTTRNPHQRRLDAFLDQLKELYGSK